MLKELLRDDNEFNSVLCPQAKHKTPLNPFMSAQQIWGEVIIYTIKSNNK
jgi:hypothetical protein